MRRSGCGNRKTVNLHKFEKGFFSEPQKKRQDICSLSTAMEGERTCKLDLFTDLSTLSTNLQVKKRNGCFVYYDKNVKKEKFFRKKVDSIFDRTLQLKTE